jgi:hypothetical protein
LENFVVTFVAAVVASGVWFDKGGDKGLDKGLNRGSAGWRTVRTRIAEPKARKMRGSIRFKNLTLTLQNGHNKRRTAPFRAGRCLCGSPAN